MNIPVKKTIKKITSIPGKLLTRRTVGSEKAFIQELKKRSEGESALDVIKRIQKK